MLYESFCTLCLASAVISLTMIPPAVDEVLASAQEVRRVSRAGGDWWKFFWGRGSGLADVGIDPARAVAG